MLPLNMFLTTVATQICPTMKLIFENFGSLKKNTAPSEINIAVHLRTRFLYILMYVRSADQYKVDGESRAEKYDNVGLTKWCMKRHIWKY